MMRRAVGLFFCAAMFALLPWVSFSNSTPRQTAKERAMIITFDDGPREWILPKILDFLRKEKIPAAFFIQCWRIDGSDTEDLALLAHQEGHGIANHTYGHGNMAEFTRKKGIPWVLNDVERCSRVIKNAVGYSPRFFRPPYWAITEELHQRLMAQGYIVQTLDHPSLSLEERKTRDVNTGDYARHDEYLKNRVKAVSALASEIRKKIETRERAGVTIHILVFHELPISLDALEILVPEWRQKGYYFRTLPWLYDTEGYGK